MNYKKSEILVDFSQDIIEAKEGDCGCINEAAETPMQHYFKTKEEALKDGKKMNLKGFHVHKTEDGKTLYMPGLNHEAFMKRHNEITQSEKGAWKKAQK